MGGGRWMHSGQLGSTGRLLARLQSNYLPPSQKGYACFFGAGVAMAMIGWYVKSKGGVGQSEEVSWSLRQGNEVGGVWG